jgi:ComF family protein
MQPTYRDISLCQPCEQYLPWLKSNCSRCALPLVGKGLLCKHCLQIPPLYDRLQALFDYAWPLREFITQFKFGAHHHFAKLLGKLMANYLELTAPVECIIPVPLHKHRQIQRGFNQTLELATIIAKEKNLILEKRSCAKIIETRAQSSLRASSRTRNITPRVFAISPHFKAKRVLVIEDIVTTGATINAFAKALKQHGVEHIEVWACCRTDI